MVARGRGVCWWVDPSSENLLNRSKAITRRGSQRIHRRKWWIKRIIRWTSLTKRTETMTWKRLGFRVEVTYGACRGACGGHWSTSECPTQAMLLSSSRSTPSRLLSIRPPWYWAKWNPFDTPRLSPRLLHVDSSEQVLNPGNVTE